MCGQRFHSGAIDIVHEQLHAAPIQISTSFAAIARADRKRSRGVIVFVGSYGNPRRGGNPVNGLQAGLRVEHQNVDALLAEPYQQSRTKKSIGVPYRQC